jgi:uncharacterized protein YndB with AHSA1/START domain
MADRRSSKTGPTKDAGWEVGVRKTVAASLPVVWEYLMGDGMALWLGETEFKRERDELYDTEDGVRGEVRTVTENVRLRLTWQPKDWPHDTVLEINVKEVPAGTTIVIHHDHLRDREERYMMLGHWKNVIADLANVIERL